MNINGKNSMNFNRPKSDVSSKYLKEWILILKRSKQTGHDCMNFNLEKSEWIFNVLRTKNDKC